jgi:anti-anti-sigma regulatory factor
MPKKTRSKSTPKAGGPPGAAVVSRDGGLGIREAETLRRDLAGAISAGGPVRLDIAGVSAVDTSIVQVLLAAVRHAAESGTHLQIDGMANSAVPRFLADVGLAPPGTAEDADPSDMLARIALNGESA